MMSYLKLVVIVLKESVLSGIITNMHNALFNFSRFYSYNKVKGILKSYTNKTIYVSILFFVHKFNNFNLHLNACSMSK